MQVQFARPGEPWDGALALGVYEERRMPARTAEFDASVDRLLARAMEASRFAGKAHQMLTVFTPRGRVVLYGLGSGEDTDDLWCQKAGGTLVAALADSGEARLTVVLEERDEAGLDAAGRAAHVGYGSLLRSYRFDKYRTTQKEEDRPSLQQVTLELEGADAARELFRELEAVAGGVFLARDLVSEPPNVLYPASYAERLQNLSNHGVEVSVLDEQAMTELGMGALLGVGQGSAKESRIVLMEWRNGADDDPPVAFVGKGVCFDTGGISLKPAAGMEAMKWDMGGSATVAGVMQALAARKARVNAIGAVGLVENMPDGNAQRPGDVVTSMSGQTIEIINTDAEGRLVLADVLWYVKDRYKPKFMVDLATLTGAMLVALGEENCGYFANDDELATRIADAGRAVGEGVWRMPLGDGYNRMMDSDIADVKNAGPRNAGSITAACFLERFVDGCPWSHMDIAGMAWASKDAPTVPKGGTGWGVRLLDHMVRTCYETPPA
ncbi:MAG: leucyl aminopeptidase [Alphaproteobacteria bacterium]|nr:leucyl aminopeptidase [Alphaproteobacteria bacterium]